MNSSKVYARRVDDAVETRGIQSSLQGLAIEVKGKREKLNSSCFKTSLDHAAGNSLCGDRSTGKLR